MAKIMNNPWITTAPVNPLIPLHIQHELTIAGYSVDRDGMLQLHQKTQKDLATLKEIEMEYRKICAKLLVEKPVEGVNNVELGNGYVAKVGIKYNYKLADNKIVEEGLAKIEAIGNQGSFIADRLVSWTPNFLVTEYRKLQEEAKEGDASARDILKITETFLTISEAAPTLEIKEPKKKK